MRMLRLLLQLKERIIYFPLSSDLQDVTAGSLPGNAIYLPYKGISRHHFELRKKRNDWILHDLGSTNGTTLNGERITEARIQVGDLIEAGIVQIRVEDSDDMVEAIPLSLEPTLPQPKTDRLSALNLESGENIFSFPKFVIPEGFILGKSPAMLEIYQKLHSVVDSDVSILFVGETGAGKELFAKLVHGSSNRSNGPFIAVNCAAIPSELVEAELFGIGERVATNVMQRKGKLAAAAGGTLFLDELEAFPIALQAKVLRAFEEKSVTPVGEHRSISVDFRLLSATNQEPVELIQAQKLREDLYHRLATLEVRIPPLRERKEDLPLLIRSLLQQVARKENKSLGGISKRFLGLLMNYSYPGNLRELLNILRATVALAHPGEVLDVHLIPERLLGTKEPAGVDDEIDRQLREGKLKLKTSVDDFTRKVIVHALALHRGNVRRAAEQLDVTAFGLRKMMKRLNIQQQSGERQL